MDSTEQARLRRRARQAYEWGRGKRALLAAAPASPAVAAAVSFSHRPVSALGFGVLTLALAAGLVWRGQAAQRAVLPGFLAGLVPLALALCANGAHHCSGGACTSWCLPACALGGVCAGLAVASVGNARRAAPAYWWSASGMCLATGAMGCACVGYAGVIGLALGFTAGVMPGLLRRALA